MNYLLFIPVMTILLTLFFGAHYGLYLFLTHFFALFSEHKMVVGVMMTILAISFFVTSFLAHIVDNAFSRMLYFLSGVWMGTFLNLLLAMIATGIVLWVLRLTGISYTPAYLVGGALFLALMVSVYGVWNALHPHIRNIEVIIPNLPEQWRGQKIVQVSDVHLGHVYREDFLQGVVDIINAEHPKLVVITGDLFDGMDGELIDFVKPLDALTAEKGVLFIDGNHETYLGTQKTFDILEQTKVHILRDEVIDIDGLTFIGIMYPEQGKRQMLLEKLERLSPQFFGKPNVLLNHTPALIEKVAKTGINLQLSGHTHQGQQFPMQYITRLVHHGYDYGKYVIGDYTLYTTSGVGTWGPTMRIGTQSEIVVITLQ